MYIQPLGNTDIILCSCFILEIVSCRITFVTGKGPPSAIVLLQVYNFTNSSAIKSFFSRSVAEYVFLPEMIQFLLCAGPRIREEGLQRKEDVTWKMILYLLCWILNCWRSYCILAIFSESWGSFCMTITMNSWRNLKIITNYWKKTVYICTIMIFTITLNWLHHRAINSYSARLLLYIKQPPNPYNQFNSQKIKNKSIAAIARTYHNKKGKKKPPSGL